MLFILTGEVQIGKTRWLSALVDDLARRGTTVLGVLSPGDWRERQDGKAGGRLARGMAGAGRYEKFGIDCVLLPDGERIRFAERRDLAEAAGAYDGASQSAKAQLGWAIDDAAIARVNAYFDAIAARIEALAAEGSEKEAVVRFGRETVDALAGGADGGSAARGGDGAAAMRDVNGAIGALAGGADAVVESADRSPASAKRASSHNASHGLLVVDELGRLELLRGEGFSSAMALLDRGETPLYRTAVIIVRDTLADIARERLGAAWGGDVRLIGPDDAGRTAIEAALEL